MSEQERLTACLDLSRRMSPAVVEQTLGDLIFLAEDLQSSLLSNIDVPLKLVTDTSVGQPFIISDYNRDGDSYRSPHSNKYFPPISDAVYPPTALRNLEIEVNALIQKYIQVYYEGGQSSVYFWETTEGTAAAVLIKKDYNSAETNQNGTWDAVHFFQISKAGRDLYNFHLTSTISLSLGIKPVNLAGNLVRKFERLNVDTSKPGAQGKTIGALVEDSENKMRAHIESLYFGKIKGIVSDLRSQRVITGLNPGRMFLPK